MEINKNIDLCCGGCQKKVFKSDKTIRLALKQYWHGDCFRCSVCQIRLTNWYFESKQNKIILCRKDYLKLYSNHCQQCGEWLTGPFMSAGEHKFHPECFRCIKCEDPIGEGEEYILVERSKIFNRKCFEDKDAPHTIHLIRVNLLQDNLLPIKLCMQGSIISNELRKSDIKISEIYESTNLNPKHIGDKVLEVNGISTQNATIDCISDIVCNSNKVLQLTIEHTQEQPIHFQSEGIETKVQQNERLFKKNPNTKSAANINNQNLKFNIAKNKLKTKERSSSMSQLLGPLTTTNELHDLARTKSFRMDEKTQKIFRPSDLVLGELLGKGFFGQVYKITEKTSGEVMVLKELHRLDEEAQRNFLKEVAVLKSLNHSNVLRFIGVLYKNSKLHLITEYVPKTLNEIIHNLHTPLPYSQRIAFARDIATGMSYLHSNNIIHRDLNSFNCLVREDMTVIVADFGLARIIYQPSRYCSSSKIINKIHSNKKIRHRKQRYTVVGNPYWMAPEMMKGKKYDEKVDVFSFGIIICELIGRVQADPDFLPRSSDFGLNHKVFMEKFIDGCPETFFLTAFICCDLNPDKRPPFNLTEIWLNMLSKHVSCSFNDNCLKEVKNYILNNNIELPSIKDRMWEIEAFVKDQTDLTDGCNDELKQTVCEEGLNFNSCTPFISRDFSETGERLRSSFRARRHKKSLQNKKHFYESMENNVLLCDTSESEPLSLIEITNEAKQELVDVEQTLNKVSQKLAKDEKIHQYTKDTFVIMNDGDLSLKNLKNLECISDLESSCDTSLNFIDSSMSSDFNSENNKQSNTSFQSDKLVHQSTYLIMDTKKSVHNKTKITESASKFDKIQAKNKTDIKSTLVKRKPLHSSVGQKTKEKHNIIVKKDDTSNRSSINIENIRRSKATKVNENVSTKLNETIKVTRKALDRCLLSEKTTESTRAKIKVKVNKTSPKTIHSTVTNTTIREKSQLKPTIKPKTCVSKSKILVK